MSAAPATATRYTIRFTGRVQGVNFRWTTCRVAAGFAVTGWAIERGARLDALSVSRPTLEDVFLGLADGEQP